MDVVMTAIWATLCALAFLACLKNPGKLYIYAAAGFAGAAIMAFLGASLPLQLVLAILATITAIIFGEAGIHAYFLIFLAIDIAIILIYILFARH
ncbi:MAG: hypothetical protein U9Q92_04995 [archaeon]|nr:hypothetical protein [archaeon]